MRKKILILIIPLAALILAAAGYGCYALVANLRIKYLKQGYNVALKQIYDTVEREGKIVIKQDGSSITLSKQ